MIFGENMEAKEALVRLLIDKHYTISCAESCTGGLLASAIVDVSDASKVLNMSFVTYANEAKVELLGVSEETISAFGVVSEEVAGQMAIGVSQKAKSNIGVGVSGIAGPTGGTEKKPVGMVCFGFSINGTVETVTCQFGAIGRNNVRAKSVQFAIDYLIQKLS